MLMKKVPKMLKKCILDSSQVCEHLNGGRNTQQPSLHSDIYWAIPGIVAVAALVYWTECLQNFQILDIHGKYLQQALGNMWCIVIEKWKTAAAR